MGGNGFNSRMDCVAGTGQPAVGTIIGADQRAQLCALLVRTWPIGVKCVTANTYIESALGGIFEREHVDWSLGVVPPGKDRNEGNGR